MVVVSSPLQRPTTRYNSRTAQANAQQQDAQHAAQLQTNQDTGQTTSSSNFVQAGTLTPNQQLQTAQTTGADAAAGHSTTATFSPNGSVTVAPTLAPSTGTIQDAERKRLLDSGMTEGQVATQEANNQPKIQDTMTNTGLGVQYDSQGRVIAGSGRLQAGDTRLNNNPAGQADAARSASQNDVSNIKGYVKQVDANGNETYVEDPNATKQAQQNAKDAAAKQAAADAQNKATAQSNMDNNAPVPPIDSFVSSLPPEQQDQASSAFGPLFDYFKSQAGDLQKGLVMGLNSLDQQDKITADYTAKMAAQNNMLFGYFNALNKQSLNNKLDIAQTTHDAQVRAEQLDADRQQTLANRAIRQQMTQNEEDRKNQLLGLGISGGWMASRQTASVISALNKGEETLSNLYEDAMYASDKSSVDMQNIESTYHNNVVDAYDKYDAANGQLFSTMMDKAAEVDKTVYGSQKDKAKATDDLIQGYLKSYGDLAGNYAQAVVDQNKFAITTAQTQRNFDRQNYQDTVQNAMKYVDTFGTGNKQVLSGYEQQLGLPPGALSDQKSLEELRLKSSGTGNSTEDTANQWLQDRVSALQKFFPNDTPEEIMIRAANDATTYFPGSSKNNATTRNYILDTVSSQVGQPLASTSFKGDGNVLDPINAKTKIRSLVLGSDDPAATLQDVYGKLTTGKDAMTEEDASAFITDTFGMQTVSGKQLPTVTQNGFFGSYFGGGARMPWDPRNFSVSQ